MTALAALAALTALTALAGADAVATVVAGTHVRHRGRGSRQRRTTEGQPHPGDDAETCEEDRASGHVRSWVEVSARHPYVRPAP